MLDDSSGSAEADTPQPAGLGKLSCYNAIDKGPVAPSYSETHKKWPALIFVAPAFSGEVSFGDEMWTLVCLRARDLWSVASPGSQWSDDGFSSIECLLDKVGYYFCEG